MLEIVRCLKSPQLTVLVEVALNDFMSIEVGIAVMAKKHAHEIQYSTQIEEIYYSTFADADKL